MKETFNKNMYLLSIEPRTQYLIVVDSKLTWYIVIDNYVN